MIISILVAMNEDLLIGVNNDLPWKLQDDLEHFKNYSLNKPIIMGRKTFESIGRPLPNRKNIVVSSAVNILEIWDKELYAVSYTHLRAHET